MKKLITAAALLALLVAACDDGPDEEPEQGEVVNAMPSGVLTNISVSFNRRDVEIVEGALGPAFTFYFSPEDVGQNPPGGSNYVIPESWGYTEFRLAVARMFRKAYSIDLAIPTGSIGGPASGAETYRAENVTISLLVMVDELNGFIANQGYCDFAFEKYKGADGRDYWRLTGWWDNTASAYDEPAVAPTSLGRVLAVFN
ncbi:MAG: hypothetical protein PVH29_02465 [Candidatus Zixiibacteriota bacterium]|jgi:hypothetical protein